MRKDLHKVVSGQRGGTVLVTAKLPSGQDYARLMLWSATPGMELSPHIFTAQLAITDKNGMPSMLKPFAMNLHEHRRKFKAEFVLDEDLDFVVRQEVDLKDDPIAKAKVKCYGKASASIRRILRNAYRKARSRAARYLGFGERGKLV